MLFVRTDIPATLLSVDIGFEIFFVELNFRKKDMATKLFLYFHVITIKVVESHLNCLSKSIDAHSSKYENIILLILKLTNSVVLLNSVVLSYLPVSKIQRIHDVST